MSNEEAAHVTQKAVDAASALTKVAAAEAAALVEVAVAAAANMAPSVLVVSMFETLQRQIEKVAGRLDESNKWMAKASEAHLKVAAAVNDLNAKVEIQNGGVKSALNWIEAHDSRMESVAIMAKGRKAQRDDDLVIVRRARAFYNEIWPVALGVVVGGLAVGGWFWSTVGGVPW